MASFTTPVAGLPSWLQVLVVNGFKFIDPRTNCVLIESSLARIDSSGRVNWDPITGGSVVLY